MFGRAVRLTLGTPRCPPVDYRVFENNVIREQAMKAEKWNVKFRAKPLSRLEPGQRVCVNAPTEVGREGVVIRADSNPESYWVRVGQSELRRNRKHLFVLHDELSTFCDRGYDYETRGLCSGPRVEVGPKQGEGSVSDNQRVVLSPANLNGDVVLTSPTANDNTCSTYNSVVLDSDALPVIADGVSPEAGGQASTSGDGSPSSVASESPLVDTRGFTSPMREGELNPQDDPGDGPEAVSLGQTGVPASLETARGNLPDAEGEDDGPVLAGLFEMEPNGATTTKSGRVSRPPRRKDMVYY